MNVTSVQLVIWLRYNLSIVNSKSALQKLNQNRVNNPTIRNFLKYFIIRNCDWIKENKSQPQSQSRTQEELYLIFF